MVHFAGLAVGIATGAELHGGSTCVQAVAGRSVFRVNTADGRSGVKDVLASNFALGARGRTGVAYFAAGNLTGFQMSSILGSQTVRDCVGRNAELGDVCREIVEKSGDSGLAAGSTGLVEVSAAKAICIGASSEGGETRDTVA